MRTTLVTAILAGMMTPSAMAEGAGPRGGGGEGQDGGRRMGMERRLRPPFGNPDEMFRRMDKDDDGQISKAEFFAAPRFERLPADKREKFFSRLDRDGDGVISREEIRAMRKDFEDRAKQEFRELDKNGDGGLDFDEFSEGRFFGKLPEEKRREIFARMDTDGDGRITPADKPERKRRPEQERPDGTNRD